MVRLFSAHQILRLSVIAETSDERIDPAGSWLCHMDHTPIIPQEDTCVIFTGDFQHEHEIPTFVQ